MTAPNPSKTHQNLSAQSGNPTEAFSVRSSFPNDFAAAQTFLQNAARQLLWWDEDAEQQRVLAAEFMEDAERGMAWKACFYGLEPTPGNVARPDPLNPEASPEVNAMDIDRLTKQAFENTLTPARVAALYIKWLHAFLGTTEPNPLPAWLEKLRGHVEVIYAAYSANRFGLAAEREVYTLVTLYVSVLLDWIADFRSMLTFGAAAAALEVVGRRLDPGLTQRLSDDLERLEFWAVIMDIIE